MDASETSQRVPPRAGRRWRRWMVVGVIFLVGCAVVWARRHGHGGLTSVGLPGATENQAWPQSLWKNARLDVAYVGDAACAPCHSEIADTFRRHPMGRSMSPIAPKPTTGVEKNLGGTTTFEAGHSRFSIERRGEREFHKETQLDGEGRVVAEVEAEITYALGSGTRGIAYLLERDGRLFQSPIAWYGQKRKWDLAPGYERRNLHFDRTIEPACLFCHANRVRPVDQAVNRYEKPIFEGHAIGCERCHGPGALHVQGQELVSRRDVTIVNPRHLEPALREAVCEQCHLQGDYRIERPGREPFDYRPGLALSSFIAILDRAGKGGNKAVRHVEQMHASRCYLASNGVLGCISCHDPHAIPDPATKAAYYKQKCLSCHDRKPCSLPERDRLARSPDDSCVLCHMPTSSNSDIVHNATTDHRISRRPLVRRTELLEMAAVGPPLVLFHADQLEPAERAAMSRELAMGLTMEARKMRELPRAAGLAQVAIGHLDQALARRPGDLVALRHKGQALVLLGRPKEGLHIYDALLKAAPNYEEALDERVALALELDDREGALAAAAQAVKVNPWSAEFHERLAYYQLQDRHWAEARHEAVEALRLDPFLPDARTFLIRCLVHADEHEQAKVEFQKLLALKPTDQDALRLWFSRQVRMRGNG